MKTINYVSTRDKSSIVTPSEAIIKGISNEGGLFVPCEMPELDFELNDLKNMSYKELAYHILKLFLTDFTESELRYCIDNAYDSKFDTDLIAPITKKDNLYFLELFHGKTLAFKDIALSILPYLLKTSLKKNDISQKIVILTATSGDTGKAALEGFANVEDTKIIVFYPKDGVSDIQKLQMITQEGNNTCVVAVNGNFDDAQAAVKNIFVDTEFKTELQNKGYILSSANSINIGRLVPQIVYYFYSYSTLLKSNEIELGDQINFSVPTGNFGNILAGFYAKKLGLPINKLICASNDNKVLYDFFETGAYNKNREFKLTISPSMDILISSNLERLIYYICNDQSKTSKLMEKLKTDGKYEFDLNLNDFIAEYANEAETLEAIKSLYKSSDYIIDTHTSVAYVAYLKYMKTQRDKCKTVIVSTASPYKFSKAVLSSIDTKYNSLDSFELLEIMSKLQKAEIPAAVKNIDKRQIKHKAVCNKEDLKDFVKNYLNIEDNND